MTEDLCHIRCIECGKVIAHKWERYQELLSQGVPINNALDAIGLTRYCCRYRMMNPFKLPKRSVQPTDPRDTGLERQVENLTIVGKNAAVMDPLQSMGGNKIEGMIEENPGYTIVPLNPAHGGIELPAIPQVALPAIPAPGIGVDQGLENITRTYQAW
ncbi:unnamed protein product [marine sediment metagenome]|uniref:Uncharacterized protein n=1 Tax=marine sediment metagenome TaxID=412755 RepID=X1IDH5_9ZZZZ